ncbi:transporter [Actinophytocola xinjiangensis]|uniref:Transporter n=1 Tax=Actinophytocola xinjiangensis TaxID=485602 RepID=A0A7Z0WSL7_9PSEU|nr:transporter [Actinophytocola xinjiangensis]
MLGRIGSWVFRRRLWVLAGVVATMALAVPFGADVTDRLTEGGITAEDAEATRADDLLNREFGTGTPQLVFVVHTEDTVESPAATAFGADLTRRLAGEPGVVGAESYWTTGGSEPLRSEDGRSAMVLLRLAGDEDQIGDTAQRLVPTVVGERDGFRVEATGSAQVRNEVNDQSERDLIKAELIAAPLSFLILLWVFRSLIAALTPVAVGLFAVVGSLVVLKIVNEFVPVSVFAVNITTALGFGLAVDYSLFTVTRFREELAAGADVRRAIATTTRTAGRTIVFSAVTVAVSMSALLLFPLDFLRSFAYSGIAVVLLAAFGAIVVLSALLAVVGRGIDRWSPQRLFRRRDKVAGHGFWHRWTLVVMRRPWAFFVSTAAVLLVMGVPLLGIQFGESDDRVLPPSAPAHVAAEHLRAEFATREDTPLSVVLPDVAPAAVGDYPLRLSGLPGVIRVDAASGSFAGGEQVAPATELSRRFVAPTGTWVSVVTVDEPYSPATADLLAKVRATPAPGEVLVGGQAAQLADAKTGIGEVLPEVLAFIAVATFVLLFLFTGSLVIPLQAIVLNLLSLSAAFGAMVFIFQDGHLRSLVGDFTVTDTINIRMPILMFCVAFGVSMDYQLFMLSRIKEHYLATGDHRASVAWGLERVGRLVTAAAVLVAVVLFAFATSGLTPVKLLGVGLAIAVIVDATLVRGALMPAALRLTGRATWWLPGWLRRVHDRVGLNEARS